MNVLVTAGATREPIDAVRFISNFSTGSTGASIAEALVAIGHRVVYVRGESAVPAPSAAEQGSFYSARDLSAQLQRRLAKGDVDAVIMAAAVSDYRPGAPTDGKLSSAPEELTLHLVRNPKILPQLKAWSPRPLRVVGFKLTAHADAVARRAAVAAQFAAGGVDLVVHNDIAEIRTLDRLVHPFYLYRSPEAEPLVVRGVPALSVALGPALAS
jgi:phosphopantothenoylcysteine decarboxylase/phosphopantothenate--cysteine ligase